MELNELFSALAKAQAEIKALPKTGHVSFGARSYSHAEFNEACNYLFPILSKHGLCISQTYVNNGSTLKTILGHSSGQFIESDINLCIPHSQIDDPQVFGKHSTYYKRYALMGVVGLSAEKEDDDAVKTHHKPSQQVYAPPSRPAPSQEDKINSNPFNDEPWPFEDKDPAPLPPSQNNFVRKPVSEKQINRMVAIAKNMGWSVAFANAYVKSLYNKKPQDLSREQYDRVCQYFEITPFTKDLEMKYEAHLEKRESALLQLEKKLAEDEIPF